MDKKLLVNGGLLAAAILAAGYVYSDKITNALGIGHKPDVQVEESVDKKEDKATSKITEVKNKPVQSNVNAGPSLTTGGNSRPANNYSMNGRMIRDLSDNEKNSMDPNRNVFLNTVYSNGGRSYKVIDIVNKVFGRTWFCYGIPNGNIVFEGAPVLVGDKDRMYFVFQPNGNGAFTVKYAESITSTQPASQPEAQILWTAALERGSQELSGN